MGKKKKKRIIRKPSSRFMAMSKLLGIFVITVAVAVIIYSMYEMHVTQDLSALPSLLGGILAIVASYIGFYINMAKAEHIEDKKNQIKKELELIRNNRNITDEEKTQEELRLQQELENLDVILDNLNTEEQVNYQ